MLTKWKPGHAKDAGGMKIIINADDLGLDRRTNDAIFRLIDKRRVTSATLLANLPGLEEEEVTCRLPEFPYCSFGVHLNISEGPPLAPQAALGPILNGQGCFSGNAIRQVKITSALRGAVYNEYAAQIERLLSLGVKISHIDSHHHVHTTPGLFPVLKRIQKRFGIRKVRLSVNRYDEPISWRLRLAKRLWNFALRRYYRTRTTRAFTSLAVFLDLVERHRINDESIELMVHPGLRECDAETQMLYTPWEQRIGFPIELISYNEL